MRVKLYLPYVFCSFLSGLFVFSPSLSAQSLSESLVMAYESHPDIQAARADLRALDENIAIARGSQRPTVSLSVETGYEKQESNLDSADRSRADTTGALSLSQTVYDSGAMRASTDQAEANVRSGRSALQEAEQAVFLNTVTSYMDVARDQAVVELRQKNVARLTRQLEATNDRFELGEVTRTDVAQAQSSLSQARADLVNARGQLEISRNDYEQHVGNRPAGSLSTTPDITLALPESREAALEMALANNPTIHSAAHNYRSARQQIEIRRAGLLPSATVSSSLTREDNSVARGSRGTGAALGLTFSIPIYQAGVAEAQLRQSRSSAAAAGHRLQTARRQITSQVTSAWERYVSSLSVIQATQEGLEASRIALEGVEQESQVGARTVLDVLNAEQEVLDDEVSLVRAKRDSIVARFQLVQATGGLTFNALNLETIDAGINATIDPYDPDVHYRQARDRFSGWGDESDETYPEE